MDQIFGVIDQFKEIFYNLVDQIPQGMVTTYGELAVALGDKKAARSVGSMLNASVEYEDLPCHRVVRSDGSVGGYAYGKEKKVEILESEGLKIENGRIVNFKDRLFSEFDSSYPLEKLKRHQISVSENVRIEEINSDFRYIGGLDTSYSDDKSYSVMYILDTDNDEEYTFSLENEIKFPYIQTYLSFRELPNYVDLVRDSEIKPDILMVDGNGIIHPQGVGLASHLGVIIDIPTIGVAKSKLCGMVKGELNHKNKSLPVYIDDLKAGYALLSTERVNKPIYVSPGHKVTSDTALQLVEGQCYYKIPRPIRKAHIKANEIRRKYNS